MAVLTSGHVVVAGGTTSGAAAPTREIDPACTAACKATAWTGAPSATLVTAQALPVDATSILVAGDDAKGATHVYRLTSAASQELTPKTARQHARVAVSPTGALLLVGGGSGTIESFVP
jgi:hypothetical protein